MTKYICLGCPQPCEFNDKSDACEGNVERQPTRCPVGGKKKAIWRAVENG